MTTCTLCYGEMLLPTPSGKCWRCVLNVVDVESKPVIVIQELTPSHSQPEAAHSQLSKRKETGK